MKNENLDKKSLLLGAVIGGAIGAITALLFAPKSGRELRRDIIDTSSEVYDKATDYMNTTIYEGKQKAQSIIDAAKRQADNILSITSDYYEDAKSKVATSTDAVQQRFESLKDAAKAGSEAFKAEINSKDNK
jgi:gas vesicle protein